MQSIELNANRQLFIDDGPVDEIRGLVRVLNQPVPYAGNPILRPSRQWEHDVGFVGTVVREEDGSMVKASLKREAFGRTGDGREDAVTATKRPRLKRLVRTVGVAEQGVGFNSLGCEKV